MVVSPLHASRVRFRVGDKRMIFLYDILQICHRSDARGTLAVISIGARVLPDQKLCCQSTTGWVCFVAIIIIP